MIALDKKGNVVIIELKRDFSGNNVEWQAIKYASYIAGFEIKDILSMYKEYIGKESNNENQEQDILDFIGQDNFEDINKSQRIILVSHRFAREVTSAVNWLIGKYKIDIKCVQLIPYYDKDINTHYLESTTILPLPGLEDLVIGAATNRTLDDKKTQGRIKNEDEVTLFFYKIRDRSLSSLEEDLRPDTISRWSGSARLFRYFHFWYESTFWSNWQMGYKVWRYDEREKDIKKREKFIVFFEAYTKSLLTKGATEGNIGEIKKFGYYSGRNIQAFDGFGTKGLPFSAISIASNARNPCLRAVEM